MFNRKMTFSKIFLRNVKENELNNNLGDDLMDQTNRNEVEFTTYDRLLIAWENSMEMVRDFEMYSKRIEDDKVKEVFKQFAEEEGMHASKLREMVLEYRDQKH